MLYYYNVRCLNATLSVGTASWWWLSAVETCSSGLMSCICIGVCKLWKMWNNLVNFIYFLLILTYHIFSALYFSFFKYIDIIWHLIDYLGLN